MRTFEQFIAEADEMGLQSRLNSGQINPQQARILQQRRAARANTPNSSALAIVPKATAAITKPTPSVVNKPVIAPKPTPSVVNKPVIAPKPNTSLAKPQPSSDPLAKLIAKKKLEKQASDIVNSKGSIGQRISDRMDAKGEKIKDATANAVADAPQNLVKGVTKGALGLGKALLKKQEAPKLGVSVGSDLGGGQVFGGATR